MFIFLIQKPIFYIFYSFLFPVIINTHTNSVFMQHIEIHMFTVSFLTLSPFGTILLCLPFLSTCHVLSTMHLLPHRRELCNLSYYCPESLLFPLLSELCSFVRSHCTWLFFWQLVFFHHVLVASMVFRKPVLLMAVFCSLFKHLISQAIRSQKLLLFPSWPGIVPSFIFLYGPIFLS